MADLEHIEHALANGFVCEYALRQCNKATLEELCNRRNLVVLSTGKRSFNRTTKNDYIKALQEVRMMNLLVPNIFAE